MAVTPSSNSLNLAFEGKLKVWGVRGNTPENRDFTIASKEQYWRW
jgi:hypothetical protein